MFHYLWNKRTLNNFNSIKDKIIKEKKNTQELKEEEIKSRFDRIRERVREEKDEKKKSRLLDKYLIEVFSLVREIIHRKLGLLLFPTQVLGGIVLHNSNIAQMNTGEGKTITAFLPICLNSMMGRKVYVVTVNEYLAKRDWELAKNILDFFGIRSGVNLAGLSREEKKDIYNSCEVLYTTGSELGFDYLRNNLITNLADDIGNDYYYAIVDEIDSLLLDEGMNPLIISQRARNQSVIRPVEYKIATKIANFLKENIDYRVDSKERALWLNKRGIAKCEDICHTDNFFSFSNHRYNFLIYNALKAKHFYKKDVDYIIDNESNKIVLIDSFTGRLVPNRVYSSGIHQAIESKEELNVSMKSKTIATITYQNFFRLFDKLSGMTGTAESESEEFRQVYGMEVITIPPYRKLIRKDRNDLIFWDKKGKYEGIINLIKKNYKEKKRPILIGSPSVEISERISELLNEEKISHYKLNAINHKQEAEIISKAGQKGSITISTNMAGRGTDIVLSDESREAGGLLVVGVERNMNRRIDDQLKGRSGRQGDPGESKFYVSLEDDLIKNFSLQSKVSGIFRKNKVREIFKKPVSGKMFNYLVSEPQESLKNMQSATRQNILNYDLLISKQRSFIYKYRRNILEGKIEYLKEKERNHTNDKDTTNNNEEKKTEIKSTLVKEVDMFWSEYLETLTKVKSLSSVKVYLPQEPQEAFFKETMEIFQKGFSHLDKKLRNIVRV